jgi:hypothetical protein
MPLQKLQFRPGVNREGTTLANEGGWFESDKIRFRSGYPEKIGGWVKDTGPNASELDPPTGTLWGVCRSLWNWFNLAGYNLLSLGTNLKFYIQNGFGGTYYDVTPLRGLPPGPVAAANAFAATTGSNVITVTDTAHGAQAGDFVTFAGAVSLGGNITAAILNAEHQVATYLSTSQYTIVVSATANGSDVGNGGAATTAAYQITTGSDTYTVGVGWGAGGWGGVTTGYTSTGWGSSAPAGLGIGVQLRLWSESNFGQNLVFNARGGPLYYWVVDTSPGTFNRAQIIDPSNTNTQGGITYWQAQSTCPSLVNYVLVSDASRFTIAFGCNDASGALFSTALDPMLIRWSDQESVLTWTPNTTNQAGDYRLSNGSEIVTALQTRQEILVLTDAAIYSMQYLGPPYVWGFQIMGDNISIMGPNAAITVNNITYWMGTDKFYMYSGRVETLPCALRQYVFDDINMEQSYQFFANTNEGYNEVWWHYCSANSTVIDKYVIFNHLERTWYYGTWNNSNNVQSGRTFWLDSPLRDFPMATTYGVAGGSTNTLLVYHENGNDDGVVNPPIPIVSYVQSSDFDIGDGHNFGLVTRIIPDVTFDGSTVNNPSLDFTVRPRQFPGTNYGSADNPTVTSAQNYQQQRYYTVQQFTQQVFVRIRGRQMAFKVESNDLGVAWQLGVPRIDTRPDGRR